MKPLQNPIVVGVLVLLALVFIFRSAFRPLQERFFARRSLPVVASPPSFVVDNQTTNAVSAASGTNVAEREISWKKVEGQAPWTNAPKRDPFQYIPLPASYTLIASTNGGLSAPVKTAQEVLALKAIWMQTGSQLAVINGKIVGEGSSILDYKVDKIEQDKVWVTGPIGQERVEFSYLPPNTNSPANPYPSSGSDSKPGSPLKN